MSSFTEKLRTLWDRLKKIKHIEIYIALVFAIIVIAIYFLGIRSPSKKDSTPDNPTQSEVTLSTSQEYVGYLENKLTNVLSKIKDAGEVNVIVTLENGFEYLYATEEETKVLADGSKVTTSTFIMVDGKPVLSKEVYPTIKGIVVTSSGADNLSVKLNLLNALQTVIDVANENITILTGK